MSVDSGRIAIALGVDDPLSGSATDLRWTMWIEDATMLIEARRLNLAADPIDELKLDYVVREAVVAHARRPDDATQVTVSVDDASTSKTYRSGKGSVGITDDWWDLLGLSAPDSGAFSLDMIPRSGSGHADICTLNFGGLYCSCGASLTNYLYPLYEV